MADELALTEIPGLSIAMTGIEFPAAMPYDDWWYVGEKLTELSTFTTWGIADWLAFGETTYGESYTQAMDLTGKSYSWLAKLKSLARKIPRGRRRPELSPSHHLEVAHLTPEEQDAWLDYAVDNRLTKDELRYEIHNGRLSAGPISMSIPVSLEEVAWRAINAWRKGEGIDVAMRELERYLNRSDR